MNDSTQKQVKDLFSHNLIKAYNALDPKKQVLSAEEFEILQNANKIYASKGFEYFDPQDALTGFKRYPDLGELDRVAKKLIG